MNQVDLKSFPNCSFGINVSIIGDKITIHPGTVIEDNVIIEAKEIVIGHDCLIEKNTTIKGLKELMTKFNVPHMRGDEPSFS